ncbi:MAG: Imm1 family immunity protein [Capsulimonas sp.]|jgi:hypothetical protein|uniref:Imm1 family immunity protein n=1 Tax=Capsulimonas sp. TaxID=2494211 RepID=UPI00326523D8
MFVTIMKAYGFVNNRHTIVRLNKPDWEDIEVAIRRMEGKFYTSVNISKSAETEKDEIFTLTIGGGRKDQYAVSVNFESKHIIHNLVDPMRSMLEVVEVPIGVEAFQVPLREIVTLDMALQGARTFAESGELDSELVWDKTLVM